jgi:hypothetical protein
MDPLSRRAVYWNDVANPVDLNTRLYRLPPGWCCIRQAINDSGSIVADSNAGLVLLRPGKGRHGRAGARRHRRRTRRTSGSRRATRSTSRSASSTAPWPSRTWPRPASTTLPAGSPQPARAARGGRRQPAPYLLPAGAFVGQDHGDGPRRECHAGAAQAVRHRPVGAGLDRIRCAGAIGQVCGAVGQAAVGQRNCANA